MHLLKLSPERWQRLNLLGDLIILGGACAAAAYDGVQIHWKVALAMTAAAAVLWLCASRVLRQYDVSNGRGLLGDLALTSFLVLAVFVPMALLRYVSSRYAVTTEIPRFLSVLLPAVFCLRLRAVGLRLWQTRPLDPILVVGAGALGRLTQREIRDGRRRGVVIGHLLFRDERDDGRLEAPVLGTVDDLESVLRRLVVNEVYIAAGAAEHRTEAQAAIRSCERFGVPFALPACGFRLARAVPSCQTAIPDGYLHYLSVPNKPLQLAVKRLIDIVASASALIVLAPLLIATALMVKLTSRGPVLFRQERVGLHGRTFKMLKFRSMVQDAERLKASLMQKNEQSGPVFKMTDDPRTTRVGRFIRKYSIDELPQLVNVLRGDMAIVGPRPAIPGEVARYEAWQRRRLSVRPGLTCVWQVSGRNQISFVSWMLLDMRYIDHWNLGQDLRLILRTLPVVLTGRGAS